MARLAAVERALFFPSPDRVVDLIASTVDVSYDGTARLLDPCAGEGVAERLARAWSMTPYGVELDEARAAECSRSMESLHGSYHQLDALDESFSVLFLNPPYDFGDEDPKAGSTRSTIRQEFEFLRDCNRLLVRGGLLVYVVPGRVLSDPRVESFLPKHYQDIEVYRFPDPEHERFKQVVLLARRRDLTVHNPYYYSSYGALPKEPFTVLGTRKYLLREWAWKPEGYATRVQLPTPSREFKFKLIGPDPLEASPGTTGGCFNTSRWKALMETDPCMLNRPLVAPRPGHVAMLLAAGALDGTEIAGGRLVKGSSEKVVTEGIDEEAQLHVKRERIVSRLSVLDLTTGELSRWRTDEAPEKTKAWFEEHGAVLATAVRRDHVPIYDGSTSAVDFSAVRAPGVLHGHTEPTILEAQKSAAVAIVRCWERRNSAILSGELGVGKTVCSVVASVLAGHAKTVVVVPTHLTKKWVREVDAITRTRGAAKVAKCLKDVDDFFGKGGGSFLILSKERAKLGARWAPAVITKRTRVTREVLEETTDRWGYQSTPTRREETSIEDVSTCPACGAVIEDPDGNFASETWLGKSKRACVECKSPLWECRPISAKGTTRWPLAKHINHRYSRQYSLILDESHAFAHPETDQSKAVQLLCSGARKILAMTGTLYGGRASSIFHLLYKLDPGFRDIYGYRDTPNFVQDHGLLETVTKLEEYTSRYGYRRNNSGGRVREVPGVNPAMLNLLLSYTVWLRISDLGYKLPEFSEHVEVVDHDPEVLSACKGLMSEVKKVLRSNPKLLGQYLMAGLGYPDCPEHAESIVDPGEHTWSEPKEIAYAPAFESRARPKDKRVLEVILEEKTKGLKTLVFFTQTGKRSPIPRVKAILEETGLVVEVLDGGVTPEDREEWLKKREGSFDVLLTNGKLVETGLDLLWANTIIQFGAEYSINTLRQSTRRSWRLGQTRSVKVIYLVYAETMQELAMSLISRKMRAAELVDGDDLGGLAQHDDQGHDFLIELAKMAASRQESGA